MFIVHVFIEVKQDQLDGFIDATRTNALASIQEPGIARFDFVRQLDAENRFVLVEVYDDEAAAAAHKETAHYKAWRERVADMMAQPRSSIKYAQILPADRSGWEV